MAPADNDRVVSTLPDGLWSQPQPTGVPDFEADEDVQRIRLPASMRYRYTPGTAMTRFLEGLKDKKFLGERCPVTGDVYVPPRGMSPVVGLPTTEQVEVGPKGSIASFCVVHIGFGVNAPPTPFVSALILLDGAAVSVYGTLLEVPIEDVRIGMRVEPVWVPDDELTTSFQNVTHWRPIDEPDVDPATLKGHF
jgi:uncharacterized OB-fold protein